MHDIVHWHAFVLVEGDGVCEVFQLTKLPFGQFVNRTDPDLLVFTYEKIGDQMLGTIEIDNTAQQIRGAQF